MIQRLFRATALILLLFSLATFSGITTTATAVLTIDSCCERPAADPERTPADPCPQGDCACLFCLSGEELPPFAWVGKRFDAALLLPFPQRLQPHDFVAVIDYPPEIA